jgi:hypothetical protein
MDENLRFEAGRIEPESTIQDFSDSLGVLRQPKMQWFWRLQKITRSRRYDPSYRPPGNEKRHYCARANALRNI